MLCTNGVRSRRYLQVIVTVGGRFPDLAVIDDKITLNTSLDQSIQLEPFLDALG